MNLNELIRVVLNKISSGSTKLKNSFKFNTSAMIYIRVFALLYFIVNLTYICFWLFSAFVYHIDLPELRQYIISLSSAGVVAVIGFLSQSLVDKNDNGIPDNMEEDSEYSKTNGIKPTPTEIVHTVVSKVGQSGNKSSIDRK